MRSLATRTSLALGALLFFAAPDSAAQPAGASSPSVIARAGKPWIHLGGRYAGPRQADVDAIGRAVVGARAAVATPVSALVTTGVDRFGDGEVVVRYAQSHLGLPVIGRGAAVRLSAARQPLATVVDLEADLPAHAAVTLAPADAATVASSRSPVRAAAKDAHLVVWPTPDRGARLAYVVIPRVPAGIPLAPRVVVDAETGEVIEARDTLVFAKARTYATNPVKGGLIDADLALTPEGDVLSHPLLTATNCIDNKRVAPVDMFGFKMNVHTCDLEQIATANEDGDFLYEPADEPGSAASQEDAFSEVSIYHHASKAYAFFRELQGDPSAQVVQDAPLRLIANLRMPAGMMTGNFATLGDPDIPLEPFQNAFFAPADGGLGSLFQQLYGFDTGALWFGQGVKRDYAYDGDVVYHEFAHAVVDATLKLGAWHLDARGAIDAPGAMNEGLADYFSSAITGDPDVGEYASGDMGGADVIRSLANDDRCPTAIVGEVHFDSTLFSGALWQARASLSEADRPKLDRGIYKAMRTNPGRGDLGYGDLATLFLATLKADFPAGAAALEAAMTARGVLPSCERILAFSGAPLRSAVPALGFVAPGKQTLGVRKLAPGIIQISAAAPADAGSVTVSFTAQSSGGGGGPFGGGKPFAPVVLAKLGQPITWDTKAAHDADLEKAGTASGKVSVTLDLPEGAAAGTVYLQIANAGDSDGSYDDVKVTFAARAPAEPGEGDEEPLPPSEPTPVSDSGCAASGAASGPYGVPLMLGAVAALFAARRRRAR